MPRYNVTLENTEERREKFIAALRETGVVSHAARQAGIPRSTVYQWRRRWSSFAENWETALDEAIGDLELKAREMALDMDGPMLRFLLQAHRPEVYAQKTQTAVNVQAGDGNASITIARVAPGVLDRLLGDSPLLSDPDRVEYVTDPDEESI